MSCEALAIACEGDVDETLFLPETLEAGGDVVEETVPLETYLAGHRDDQETRAFLRIYRYRRVSRSCSDANKTSVAIQPRRAFTKSADKYKVYIYIYQESELRNSHGACASSRSVRAASV